MPSKHKTKMIAWHSGDPSLKQWIRDQAERRGQNVREFLDHVLSEYRDRHDPAKPEEGDR